jgi:hypothetical protein
LNISRGGIRVVIEERVELGQEFEIRELDHDIADGGPFYGRVVWVQDEPDGSVVGMEFVGAELPKFGEKAASTAHPPSSGAAPVSAPSSVSSPQTPAAAVAASPAAQNAVPPQAAPSTAAPASPAAQNAVPAQAAPSTAAPASPAAQNAVPAQAAPSAAAPASPAAQDADSTPAQQKS